jgi:hypothetical protein
MAWAATAVAGATLVSGYMGSRSADKASDAASDASAAQLSFEYEKYDDWNETYGPLQDNLAEYYNNVTPEYYAAVGVEKFNEEFQVGMKRIDESFAQRGIDPSSGISNSIKSQAELDAAETRAGIRREAPRQATEDQGRFLQIGLGQNPGSSISSTLSQRSREQSLTAQNASTAAGNAWGAAIPAAGNAIEAWNAAPAAPAAPSANTWASNTP